MPVYTLNLFDIIPGKEAIYRQYSKEAGRVINSLGGKVVTSGWHPTTLLGDDNKNFLIVVEFPDMSAVESFLHDSKNAAMHQLRETSTENYIWKIFDPWDLKRWVAFPSMK
jgi:uncharacterized protein (DUF1330 family)